MAFFYTTKFRASWWWQLKKNGYDVIPIRGKNAPCKGWPLMANDKAAIERWNGSGAAIRMRGSQLLVVDFDIHVAVVRDQMLDWMNEHHPEFMQGCLRRHSERVTLALIGRCVTAKPTQKTARYVGEGTDPKGDLIEIFTTNSKRYVGVVGEHSYRREYGYIGKDILEMPVDQLPWLADCELAPMAAAFEQIMTDCGWQKVIPVIGEEARGSKLFDLTPDMVFTLSDDTEVTLEELEDMAKHGATLVYDPKNPGDTRLRGYAFLWDPLTGRGDYLSTRVLVSFGAEGLCLYDTKFDVRHRWKSAALIPDEIGEKLREILKALHDQQQAEVRS